MRKARRFWLAISKHFLDKTIKSMNMKKYIMWSFQLFVSVPREIPQFNAPTHTHRDSRSALQIRLTFKTWLGYFFSLCFTVNTDYSWENRSDSLSVTEPDLKHRNMKLPENLPLFTRHLWKVLNFWHIKMTPPWKLPCIQVWNMHYEDCRHSSGVFNLFIVELFWVLLWPLKRRKTQFLPFPSFIWEERKQLSTAARHKHFFFFNYTL